ncbi:MULTISPECIES: F0F1 ATP synthase subunit epsilon [unclassified Schlesneria]|uniref:F0F1 ATP synthase subunit epsilon n=1 Tax=Schlesneria TaxID=656899 RepID=UPI002EF45A69
MSMRVKIVVPSGIFLEQRALKVVAEAKNGSFCLLPRHVDFVTALTSGILSLTPDLSAETDPQTTQDDASDLYIAIDEGILVKRGADVLVSTWNAVQGPLGELNKAIQAQFAALGEKEQQARLALEHLEASLVRQVLGREGGGYV